MKASPSCSPEVRRLFFGLMMGTLALLLLPGCSGTSLRKDYQRDPPSYAKPPAQSGILAEISAAITTTHGAGFSGFMLLDGSKDALMQRLALIDSATTSLDIQTYLWYPDGAGLLILERALQAAQRGVHVRLIVDDLLTIGQDQFLFELDLRPNIEMRMFNPWEDRGMISRAGEMLVEMERLNTRMHDKLMIVDGQAAIIGGRNLGDHYYGLSKDYNFHDLDLLSFGEIVGQARGMFDHFWNSEWVVSASNLDLEHDPEYVDTAWAKLQADVRAMPSLQSLPLEVRDWSAELRALQPELRPGTAILEYDETGTEAIEQNVAAAMFPLMNEARHELLITNAYVIPGEKAIAFLQSLTDRGVKVRMLTNSLASHDVPAVNAHYESWRDDLIRAGVELHELRPDGDIKASVVDIAPTDGEFIGLHTKAVVIDRSKVFIGSMNFDPRSWDINTEAGAIVSSPELAEDLVQVMYRDMLPENSWEVLLDEEDELYWISSDEILYKQPARKGSQRIMSEIFKVVPKEQY